MGELIFNWVCKLGVLHFILHALLSFATVSLPRQSKQETSPDVLNLLYCEAKLIESCKSKSANLLLSLLLPDKLGRFLYEFILLSVMQPQALSLPHLSFPRQHLFLPLSRSFPHTNTAIEQHVANVSKIVYTKNSLLQFLCSQLVRLSYAVNVCT